MRDLELTHMEICPKCNMIYILPEDEGLADCICEVGQ